MRATRLRNKKIALFGLCILLFAAALLCIPVQTGNYIDTTNADASECRTISSIAFLSRDSLALLGALTLFVAAFAALARRGAIRRMILSTFPPRRLGAPFARQAEAEPNRLHKAFRKGILHAQIYDAPAPIR